MSAFAERVATNAEQTLVESLAKEIIGVCVGHDEHLCVAAMQTALLVLIEDMDGEAQKIVVSLLNRALSEAMPRAKAN